MMFDVVFILLGSISQHHGNISQIQIKNTETAASN